MADEERLVEVRRDAEQCQRWPLWEPATQTVFGEGPPGAPLMLVGEQPGDRDDLAGRVFVGPAGGMLDRALALAEMDDLRLARTCVASIPVSGRKSWG